MGGSAQDLISEFSEIDYTDSIATALDRIKNGESFDKAVKGLEIPDTAFSSLHKYVDATDQAKLSVDDFAKGNESAMKSVASSSTSLNAASKSASAFGTVMKTIGGTVLNMAIGAGVGLAITGIVKLLDQVIVTSKEADEAMESAFSDYDSAQQNLSDVNSELEQTQSRISELQSKGKLTFVEQEELEKLKETNAELQIQQDLAEKNANKAARDAGDAAVKAYEKNFGDFDVSQSSVNEYLKQAQSSSNNVSLTSNTKNLSAMIAGLTQLQKLQKEAQQSSDQEQVQWYQNIIDTTTDSIWDQIDALSE